MKCLAAKQLKARALKVDPNEGAALHNIYKIGVSETVLSEIRLCLESEDSLDNSTGLYYFIGLLQKYSPNEFDQSFIEFVIKEIPVILERKTLGQERYYALILFDFFRNYYPSYRKKMLEFLKSDDLGDRKMALVKYKNYCYPQEVEPLLIFASDDIVTESSMCGPLSYELRNQALETISEVTGKNFMIRELKERHPDWGNDYVSWYDWQPFWEWYKKQNDS